MIFLEYIIRLSEDYEKCKRALNRLGIVTYKSQEIEGLIGYWSKLEIGYLRERDFIEYIEIEPKGYFYK